MRNVLFSAATVGIAMLSTPVMAAELVNNGTFETGNFAGWTAVGDLGQSGVAPNAGNAAVPAISQDFRAYFKGNTGGLYQDLATVAGGEYLISFLLEKDGGSENGASAATVKFDGTTIFSEVGAASSLFNTYRFYANASSTLSRLEVSFSNEASYYNVDNFSVTQSVPEAATWAMMLVGFGAIGGTMRQRRRSTKVTHA